MDIKAKGGGSDDDLGFRKEYDDQDDMDKDDETDPLIDDDDVEAEEKEFEEDDGKIFGISKTLIPFYGVYKLISKAGPYPLVVLLFLLFAYLHNQLVRYTLSITAKEVAQDLQYGNRSCMMNTDELDNITRFFPKEYKVYKKSLADWVDVCDNGSLEYDKGLCNGATVNLLVNDTEGNNVTLFIEHPCSYDYDGTGLLYQLVAGPLFNNVYIIAGVFLGFAADLANRKVLLVISLVWWSLMTGLTGLTQKYWQLALLRFAVAIGAAGCTPFAASIMSDYFPMDLRGFAFGIYNWGIYTGYSMSYALGNEVTVALNWRWVFYIAAFMGFAIAPLILIGVREPKRTANASRKEKPNDQVKLKPTEKMGAVASLFIPRVLIKCFIKLLCPTILNYKLYFSPGLLLLCIAGGVRNAGGYVWAYNTELFYEKEKDLTKQEIAQFMSWIPLVGGSLGAFLGGVVSDLIIKGRGPYHRIWVLIISQILAAPFALGGLLLDYPLCFYSLIFSNIIGEMWIGVTLALVVDLVPSYIRTTIVAVYLFIVTLIGGNFNLAVAAFISAGLSRTTALVLCFPCLYALSSVLFLITFFVMRYDLKKKKQHDEMPLVVNEPVQQANLDQSQQSITDHKNDSKE
ncbi:MFS-type efflux pump MSMEG_3705-like isoform X2 [Dysidea avara]|uniref:MFS-type efflux pump MSMEG_3705-like isoform X2 n=1 Tax=Dysidea avara TaxID=196820 RepID=UPI003319884C